MIIKCISNKLEKIRPRNQLSYLKKYIHNDEVDLIVGKIYNVFGIALRGECPWFYVLVDDDITSLRIHYSGFFEILDSSLSAGWQYCQSGHSESGVAFLPKQWAETPGIYEELIDDNPDALVVFSQIRHDILQTIK